MWAMVVLAGGYTICISKSSYVSAQVLMWAHLSLGHLLIYKQIEFKSEILLSTSNESRKRLFLNFSQMWGGGLSQGFFQATSRKQAHFASFKFRGGSRWAAPLE